MRLINADTLMETIRTHDYPLRDYFNSTDRGMFTSGIQQAVDEQPTIDAVEVKHGEWIEVQDWLQIPQKECGTYRCSDCGQVMKYLWNYCPNCGAKMDGEDGAE